MSFALENAIESRFSPPPKVMYQRERERERSLAIWLSGIFETDNTERCLLARFDEYEV